MKFISGPTAGFIALLLLAVMPQVFAGGFSFGGFGFGGGSEDSGSSNTRNIDLGKIWDTGKDLTKGFSDVSEEEESLIGRDSAAVLLGSAPLNRDRALSQYINKVGRWLASNTERPNLPWRFAVLDTSSVNAFAAPGGYIFITMGLLSRLNNEAELAGVLAHEISHVLRRHHVNAVKKKARANALKSGLDIGLSFYGQGSQYSELLLGTVKDIYSSGLDKDDEYQSDHMGVVIAARSGYDPYGLLVVLMMLDSMGAEDSDLELMFQTHPSARDRIEKLSALMQTELYQYAEQPRFKQHFLDNTRIARK
ncbi:MAG: hypothetical protein BMS9Abin26_2148 [Gammaproteobacteria bacterium]|nr:MAG: hypothetical protein BMS9Abin26_2148 [Gammaproteobacteria bacterium]